MSPLMPKYTGIHNDSLTGNGYSDRNSDLIEAKFWMSLPELLDLLGDRFNQLILQITQRLIRQKCSSRGTDPNSIVQQNSLR
jgi:hypothetical protein